MDDLQRKPKLDDPERDRLMTPDGEMAPTGGGPADLLKALQQTVGNTAMSSLIHAQAKGPTPGKAAKSGGGSSAGDGTEGGFESGMYEQSILGPLRAAYACVRSIPPDHELALQHLQKVGEALWDYEQRYRGSDEGLANGFYAARGWLGRVARELTVRLGSAKPMSDETIAAFVSDTILDLNTLEKRLH